MKPTKAKTFIADVAVEKDLSEELVGAVVTFYWQEVRKALSSLKNPRVHLTNLGDFVVKHWKLEEKMVKLEKFEESNRLKGLQKMTARFKTVETLYDIKSLTIMVEEEKQRADFIKMHKVKTNVTKQEHN